MSHARNIFVLGGHGDIGHAIVGRFNQTGDHVLSPSSQELNLEDKNAIEWFLSNQNFVPDVLIQSAGWNQLKMIGELPLADIQKTMAVNVIGFFQIVKHFIPEFKKRNNGYIIAVSSLYGTFARSKRTSYVTSKHALNGLMKSLAIELGPFNIKVNTVSPGFVDTKMTRKNNDENTIKDLELKIPLRRLAQPKDIANIVYFLCSSENNYINGQDIIVDGGYSIGGFQT
jgi:3-oxoacyl-[acyl-carrier protein] reductase